MKLIPGQFNLQADDYAEFVLENLEKDNLDIYYPPYDDMFKNQPRYETERSRL